MAPLVTIEDRTYRFALELVRAYRGMPPVDAADRVMWQQLLKAGTSIGANSAESGGAQSRNDWLTRRYIALKEAREAQFWLRLLNDTRPSRSAAVANLQQEAGELVAILTAAVRTATGKWK